MASKMLLVSEDYIAMLKQYGGKSQTEQEETTDTQARKNVEKKYHSITSCHL